MVVVEAQGLRGGGPGGGGGSCGGGELLLLLLLLLLRLKGLLGLRLLDIFLVTFRGLGESEYDDDLPRLPTGGLALLGEIDLERERTGLLIGGDLLRLRLREDLLGGLLALPPERRLGGGERLRIGLPRIRRGEALGGDRL